MSRLNQRMQLFPLTVLYPADHRNHLQGYHKLNMINIQVMKLVVSAFQEVKKKQITI